MGKKNIEKMKSPLGIKFKKEKVIKFFVNEYVT